MSIDISSKLMLVPKDNTKLLQFINNVVENEGLDFYEVLEDLDLNYASPWFDADPQHWDIGVELSAADLDDLLNLRSDWHVSLSAADLTLVGVIGPNEELVLRSCQHVC